MARRSEVRQGQEGEGETADADFLAVEHGSASLTTPWRSSQGRSREFFDGLLTTDFYAQYGLFVILAIQLGAIAAVDLFRTRSRDSILLALWVAGTFVFATYLNWSVTARTVLPLAVPGAILIVRRLDRRQPAPSRGAAATTYALIVPALAVSVWVMWGDYVFANTFRKCVRAVLCVT